MAKVTIDQAHVIRAMMHAFPSSGQDAYQPLWLEAGPSGLRLLGLHMSQGLIGQLEVSPTGLAAYPEEPVGIGVMRKHLRGAVEAGVARSFGDQSMEATLDIGASIDFRIFIGDSTEVRRRLPSIQPGIKTLPKMTSFNDKPHVDGLRPTLMAEAYASLQGVPDTDTLRLSLSDGDFLVESDSPLIPASFKESVPTATGPASSQLVPTLLEESASFASHRGLACTGLGIAIANGGLMRIRYAFEHGTMTYWITAAING